MNLLNVDFSTSLGKVKPMHAVNNGPVISRSVSNADAFVEAGIPYARNHDASFSASYGGEHTVDVHAIFPNFDADPEDPDSYDFFYTDKYVARIDSVGCETFYRLGSKIEHGEKKYGTLKPKDFKKWAVICEHIIRHYTEGWANGFNYKITYWEIWNEPDLGHPCWNDGTPEDFCEFFNVALVHLKEKFPHLKIGGPAWCHIRAEWTNDLVDMFYRSLRAKPDFVSWHKYSNDPHKVVRDIRIARELFDSYGLTECESILNEWNYVYGWQGEDWKKTVEADKGIKGAAFVASTMCLSLYEKLDMLMYYDARPCTMNGMFDSDIISKRLKGYYTFWMFNKLYRMDCYVPVQTNNDKIVLAAAKAEGKAGIMVSYFDDDGNAPAQPVTLTWQGTDAKTAKVYVLDENNDAVLDGVYAVKDSMTLKLSLYSTVYIELE